MDDFKPNFQDVFLTFGLGALLFGILAFRVLEGIAAVPSLENLAGPDFADALWVPISAGIVFVFHALGKFAIGFGRSKSSIWKR
jgi:hypothetical protein